MMNANEMRKITEAKVEEKRQAIIKECDNYIENEIAPNVKRTAECGYGYCILEKKYNIPYDYIVEKLTELGYEVKTDNRNITITW